MKTNEVPLPAAMAWEEKKNAAVEDFKSGLPRKLIAQKYGYSESTISNWARQAGCPQRPRGSKAALTPSARDQEILARLEKGESVADVAMQSSVSRATIYNVHNKWSNAGGIEPPVGTKDAPPTQTQHVEVVQESVAQEEAASNPAVPPPSDMDATPPVVAGTVADAGEHHSTRETLQRSPESIPPNAGTAISHATVAGKAWDTDPGPFPIHALNPVMRRMAEETAKVRRVAVELPGMTAIATLAGSLGKGWKILGAVNGCETYGNIYLVIGAGQSYGKGVAAAIMRPLLLASDDIAAQFTNNTRPKLRVERKLLAREQKHLLDKLTNPKECGSLDAQQERQMQEEMVRIERRIAEINALAAFDPTFWVGNVTSAALTGLLARNGQALMSFSAEAGELVRVVLGKFTRGESADFDLYLSGYTVESYRETRVGRGDTTLVPWLSTCWLCQPCILRELLGNREAMNRGMVARILAFTVEAGEIPLDDGVVREVPVTVWREWAALVQTTLTIRSQASQPVVITCSPEAREVFRSFFNEATLLGNEVYQDTQGVLGRWRENAIRVAVGQCVADALTGPAPVDAPLLLTEDQARRAVEITLWCGRSGLKMQAAARRDELRARLDRLSQLLSRHGGKMTLRDLRDRHCYEEDEVKAVAEAFPHRLELIEVKPDQGRPSRVLVLRTNLGTST